MKDSNQKKNASTQNSKIKNVLFLLTDQHRADCLGCYGNDIVQTPNIDYLAENGVRFMNAYTPAATRSPARACMQTGVLAHRHGMIFNSDKHFKGGMVNLSEDWPVFATQLRDKGYNLAHIGKWHIGIDNRPKDYGYEGVYYPGYGFPSNHPHYIDYLKNLGIDWTLSETKQYRNETFRYSGLQHGPQDASIPAYLASQTIDKLNQYSKSNNPFFLCTSFWGPHAPYLLTEKHFRMYDSMDIPVWENFRYDMSNKPEIFRQYWHYWGINHLSEAELSVLIGKYYAYISLIDEEIGRILKTLKDNNMLENTLIVYSSDHGSTVGSHGMWDKGFGMYDCTERVPLIMTHPQIENKGAKSDEFVSLLDIPLTFLETAGCTAPDLTDGVSLLPILDDPIAPRCRDHIICEHFGHQVPFWERMVRTDTEKYIYNPTSIDEFYDLENDPHEMDNLIDKVPEKKLKSYRDRLYEWMKQTEDPIISWAQTTLDL